MAKSILDSLNKRMEREELRYIEANAKDNFSVYEECVAKKITLDVVFTLADTEGNLSSIDKNGVTIVLKNEEFKKTAPYYSSKIKDKFIGISLYVKVLDIDIDNNTIYVSSANGSSVQDAINSSIFKEINSGKNPVVRGTIFKVTEKYAVVNLFNMGVMGRVYVQNWSNGYIRYLQEACKKGEVYTFKVVKPRMFKNNQTDTGKSLVWILDRASMVDDPWDNIPQDLYPDTENRIRPVLIVKCIDKPVGKSYWWGTCDRVKEIEMMGDFTQTFNENSILVGESYKCKVSEISKKVDEDGNVRRKFSVVPFATIDNRTDNVVIRRKKPTKTAVPEKSETKETVNLDLKGE